MTRFFLAALFFFMCLSTASATNYGLITVQEIPMTEATERTAHGYVEYRFRITNRDSKAHQVSIELPRVNHGTHGVSLVRAANSVEVPPESTVVMRVLQPPVRLTGNDEARVAIDERYQRDSTAFKRIGYHMEGAYNAQETANVLVGQGVPADIRDFFQKGVPQEDRLETETEVGRGTPAPPAPVVHYTHGRVPDPEVAAIRAQVPVAEWSDHWLAYTRFDAVVLTSAEWRELNEQHAAVAAAVRQYVEAGGMLTVVGTDWTTPKEWGGSALGGSAKEFTAMLGQVYVMGGTVNAAKPDIARFRELALKQSRNWRSAIGDLYSTRFGGGGSAIMTSETGLLQSMPVVANYGVNVKLIMLLIVVFAVLIGPVNIYVLSLLKRRIWLLWTVPVTSLVASLLVLGVSFFQEGLLRQNSSATYTILDQRREEAITFGFIGFYSTLTPRGITFSPDTEATACMDRSTGSKSLEMHTLAGGNQFFTRGWISARVPSYFAVRKVQTQQKLRVAFDWDDEVPTAVNGLGVDINLLQIRGPDGQLYTAHNAKAGDKVTLSKSAASPTKPGRSAAMENLKTNYEGMFVHGPTPTLLQSAEFLPPGAYTAEIDAWNPFLEQGIDRMKPYRSSTTIFGIFE